ncbi:hypothetical protein [[Mycoplasma] gypis]|uniref:Uncharacterized protein n=1 Tax=[Mycoplasma] gypis TaxID=92404 RepID=A0ABZ2RR23_9BACT|nr:hypothetical protein [[Mycoplasma] gypis]MBN0919391.1 hypothetical protein [[Mycoplasma] gypis]
MDKTLLQVDNYLNDMSDRLEFFISDLYAVISAFKTKKDNYLSQTNTQNEQELLKILNLIRKKGINLLQNTIPNLNIRNNEIFLENILSSDSREEFMQKLKTAVNVEDDEWEFKDFIYSNISQNYKETKKVCMQDINRSDFHNIYNQILFQLQLKTWEYWIQKFSANILKKEYEDKNFLEFKSYVMSELKSSIEYSKKANSEKFCSLKFNRMQKYNQYKKQMSKKENQKEYESENFLEDNEDIFQR